MDPFQRKFQNEIESTFWAYSTCGGMNSTSEGDSSLPSVLAFRQEQSEIGAVWKVVDGFVADDEDSRVVKAEDHSAEDDAGE